MKKQWIIKQTCTEKFTYLQQEKGLSSILSKILASRTEIDISSLPAYFSPSLDQLHNPFLLQDMEQAVKRTLHAMQNRESILVYGDYDVDGVSSTSMVINFFRELQYPVHYFVPDRFQDGYGITMKTAEKILTLQPKLMITVDCGISAIEEIKYLMENKIDVIVTDHHECSDQLPPAIAVVNPQRHDNRYPFQGLSGSGVAFKFICAICSYLDLPFPIQHLELASLGTVADVMPLTDENRSIVHLGLERIKSSPSHGMKTLLEICNTKQNQIHSYTLGFLIGPRINAGGRMGDASRGVRLFTSNNPEEVKSLAISLHQENQNRQELEQSIFKQAIDQIESNIDFSQLPILVVCGEDWHHGVIGIVASRLVERYYKPTLVFSIEGEFSRASGRSVEELNLYEAVASCSDLFERFGGHEMAVGITIKSDQIDVFRNKINAYAMEVLSLREIMPKIFVDAMIQPEDISVNNIQDLQVLQPFGQGNPPPLFLLSTLSIEQFKKVGNEKHLKATFFKHGYKLDAIGFSMASLTDTYQTGDEIDVVCSLETNEWNQKVTPQLKIKDLRPSERFQEVSKYVHALQLYAQNNDSSSLAHLDSDMLCKKSLESTYDQSKFIHRSDLEIVYKYIRSSCNQGITEFRKAQLEKSLQQIVGNHFTLLKTELILHCLDELHLIKLENFDLYYKIQFPLTTRKANLEDSLLYRSLLTSNLQL